jgi:hypothetical protein
MLFPELRNLIRSPFTVDTDAYSGISFVGNHAYLLTQRSYPLNKYRQINDRYLQQKRDRRPDERP